MNQRTYYIFRHGQTWETQHNFSYGDKILTAPILKEAKPILEKMGDFLRAFPSDFNC